MSKLTDLRSEIEPHVPGCPEIMVDDAILKVVVDFCVRSRAWRYVPETVRTSPGTEEYEPDLPGGTAIAWLLSAAFNGSALNVTTKGDIPAVGRSGQPTAAYVFSDAEIGLRNIPNRAGDLEMHLALRPTPRAKEWPDDLHVLYGDHIANGVLARLWAQPRHPWAAVELVPDARIRYEAGLSDAEYRAGRGNSSAPPTTAMLLIGGR